jgi:ribosomal protein S4
MCNKTIKGFNKKKFKPYSQSRLNLSNIKNLGKKLKAEKWSFLRFQNDFKFFPRGRLVRLNFFYTNILNIRRVLKRQNCFLSTSSLLKIYRKARNGNSKHLKFLNVLESRLDVSLFRSGIFSSPLYLRQFIAHGNVYLNGKQVNKPGIFLKKNDLVQVDFSNLDLSSQYISKTKLGMWCSHLEISKSTFSFIYLGNFTEKEVPYINKDNSSFLNYVFKR